MPCFFCGAAGTNQTTCPFNTNATNPNPEKHNKSPLTRQQNQKQEPAPGPEEIVLSFIKRCTNKHHCRNGSINNIMTTGLISVSGKQVSLPDINPFKYIDSSWLPDDRISKMINIADALDEGFVSAISLCLEYYISNTEIAFLLYAMGLLGMFLWTDVKEFPLILFDEPINLVIPLKSLQKWSLFNMFLKIMSANVLTANCLLSTVIEAVYLQDQLKFDTSKIFLRMQHPKSMTKVLWRSTMALGDIGSMATHFATSFQDRKKQLDDVRLAEDDDFVCTKKAIPYKGNEQYIAMSLLYVMISFYKNMLRKNRDKLQSKLFSLYFLRAGYMFYHLRVLLEHKLAVKPVSTKSILLDYTLDFKREIASDDLNNLPASLRLTIDENNEQYVIDKRPTIRTNKPRGHTK